MHSNILYHYTDFTALDGILAHAELRLNNVLNMNDASEMNLFMSGLCKNITDTFLKEGNQEKARLTWLIFMKEQKDRFSYSSYAACFSRYRDDAAQWERYANAGRGICIAFQADLLSKMTTGALSMQSVLYQDRISTHPLADELHAHIAASVITDASSLPAPLRTALNHAWEVSAVYKHPSFSSENEVRLLISPFDNAYFDVQPQYHISRDRIKKYYPLDLQKMCEKAGVTIEELIPELIIGPESTQSLPILQDYLVSHGLSVLSEHVSYSKCPLRRSSL